LKEISIDLGTGTIESGFNSVRLELRYDGERQGGRQCKLPANQNLKQLLLSWKALYPYAIKSFGQVSLAPVFETEGIKNISRQDIKGINQSFKDAINDWLNRSEFGDIIATFRSKLNPDDRILIIIVSEQANIWRLPWHYWSFFDDHHQSVEVFCKPINDKPIPIELQCNGGVNIFGLIGQDPKLNLNLDFLKTLPQVKQIKTLKTTSAYEFGTNLNQGIPWDVFIFNGHANTVEDISTQEGIIYLDNDTHIEISDLKTEVKKAVDRRLQIAIFNCCSGLGIAEQLSDVNIPYIIVMREKIPNLIAQRFLEDLLTKYSQGDSFPEAFRSARERLKLSEGGFAKVADWLPILFHNPFSKHVTWQDLSITVAQAPPPSRIAIIASFLKNHQIPSTVVVSLLSSLALLSPFSLSSISPLDDKVANLTQATTEALISPERSIVTIVNYDKSVFLGNTLNDDSELIEILEKVEQITKPLIWGIDLQVIPEPKVFNRPNVVQGCNDAESITNSKSTKCDRQPSIDTILKQANLRASSPNNWNSNSLTENSLRRILSKIDIVKFSEIFKKSPTEIKKLFDNKIVLVGLTNYQEATTIDYQKPTSTVRKAIELDRIIRANRSQNPLPLPIDWSNMQKFAWVFGGSVLGGLALWHRKWKLLLTLVIIGQIVIAIVFIGFGYGVPIVVSSIAIFIVGGVIYMIQHLSLDRPA
jgi:hypothetical protein